MFRERETWPSAFREINYGLLLLETKEHLSEMGLYVGRTEDDDDGAVKVNYPELQYRLLS